MVSGNQTKTSRGSKIIDDYSFSNKSSIQLIAAIVDGNPNVGSASKTVCLFLLLKIPDSIAFFQYCFSSQTELSLINSYKKTFLLCFFRFGKRWITFRFELELINFT